MFNKKPKKEEVKKEVKKEEPQRFPMIKPKGFNPDLPENKQREYR